MKEGKEEKKDFLISFSNYRNHSALSNHSDMSPMGRKSLWFKKIKRTFQVIQL